MQETIFALCLGALWESHGLGCSNYLVPAGRDVKRLSIDLHAPGDGPKPNEGWRGGEWLVDQIGDFFYHSNVELK